MVLDETNDKSLYNFEVPLRDFNSRKADVWVDGLRQVGLELKRVERRIEFTIIEKTPPAAQSAPHH